MRSFADLRLRAFAVICALLRAFACFCVRPRLERPRLGTADFCTPRVHGCPHVRVMDVRTRMFLSTRFCWAMFVGFSFRRNHEGFTVEPSRNDSGATSFQWNDSDSGPKVSRKGFCRNPRGIFPTEFPGEFCRGFFGGFFSGLFPWKKQEEKIHPKIHGNFQIGIWEFRGQNPHCKDPALTKSELQAKSRSYGPRVRVTAGQTSRIRTESQKRARIGLGASSENPP